MDTTTLFNDTNALALIGDPWALVVSAGSASVAQVTGLSGTVSSHLASGLMVADGAATVAANINALQAVLDTIQAITLTDGGTPALPLTAQQLADDGAVLQKINGTWSITLSGSLNVQQAETAQSQGLLSLVTGGAAIAETAANVAAGLDALQGLGSAIASITLTDDGTPSILVDEGTILADSATLAKIGGTWNLDPSSGALTAVQALSLSPSVTSHLFGSLAVADSAANIVTSLDALQAAGSLIGPITLTDGSTPSLALNLSQFTHDADALGKITSPYTISLSSPLTVDQAVTAQEQGLLGKVAGGAAIADTAAHVRGGIDGLQNLGGAVASITLTNGGTPALSLTAQQLIGDADALVKIGGGWTISLSGSLTVAQAASANAQGLLGRITNGAAIADSGASVQAALSTLGGFTGAIASISLTDITSPVLSLTAAAVAADHAVLALIDGDWQLTVSSGTNTVAEALAIGLVVGSHLAIGLDIHDSASNVLNSLASLTAVQSMIGAITLADATPPDLAINAATFTTGAVILQKIGSPFTIGLSGTLTAQQAVSANGQGLLVTVDGGAQISDTIAGLVADLDAVQSLGSHIAAISLNGDDGTALILTAATVLADAGALAKITGTWTLSIASGTFTAAQAVNLDNMITSHLATALNIVDGSADIAAQIDALQAMGGNIATITPTDDAPVLALTAAQFVNDADTLLKIDGTYAITLSGTLTVDRAATAFSRGLLNKIPAGAQISDSAANIQTGLDGLQAEAGTLAGISLNNGGTPAISVTAARLMADADALALIGGSWNLAITSGTLTAAQALALPQSVVSRIPGELSVTSGQNSLDGLQGIVSAVATVAFDASNTQLSLTSARFVDDTPTLLKVTSTYTIVLTGTLTAAQAINANTNGLLALVTGGAGVSDTAANINAALDPLEGFADRIAAITLTDEATPTITITAATLVADADALALISGNYHLAVSSGSVTAAQALALPSRVTQHLTDGLSVADSMVNVTADLTLLEAMVEAGSVASIILTDSGQPSIALSSTTIMTDVGALGAIAMHSDAGSFALSASSGTFTAAQVTSLLGHGLESDLSGTFAVTDSASHMVANLPALQTLAAGGHLGAVTLTTAPAALSVTAAQAGADATAINDVMGGSGANPHAILYVNGTTGGDTVNVSALTHATNINLIGDSASMFANGGIAFIDGSADSVALGSAASTIHYTAGQGVEVIDGFQIGTHLLDWALSGGADASEIAASDVTYNGNAAVAITQGSDTTHGVILVNPGVSAEVIMNDHLFTAGTHALIT